MLTVHGAGENVACTLDTATKTGDADVFTCAPGVDAGRAKWCLAVQAPKTLYVASLLYAASGHLNNVSR